MKDVLKKLQHVKIQNKSRLSEEDQRFCQIQQKLYDSTRNHFLSMFVDMETLHQQELSFYGRIQKYADRVYQQNLISMDKKKQTEVMEKVHNHFIKIIYVFLTIFLYLLKCPQSLILSALRAFCFCGKPHISRSIFLYFLYQTWLKSW